MKYAEDVIIKPIRTEKSSILIANGKYTFEVATSATKVEIKNAVEQIFGVKVKKVSTLNYDGKNKRVGVHQGKTKAWKKAVVEIDKNPSQEKYLTKGGKEAKTNRKYKTEIQEIDASFANN